ncbi:MAG: ketoacyl-ACP synthase III [Turicibacter sp.]|nr:ketoacyl-ACP synthase III [Turicibacter sp.]
MKIIGTGAYVPSTTISNDDLSKFVDTNDEWISTRTGIRSRHISSGENTSDFAVEAAKKAMAAANVTAEDIDFVIVATFTPDQFTPTVASMVQHRLGIPQAMSFDLNAACSGFVYGLTIANGLMQTGHIKCGLLIGAETISKVTDWSDRNTCILFGDGAGAVVLQQTEDSAFLQAECKAIPDVDASLSAGGVPITNPLFKEEPKDLFIKMAGQEVFKFATKTVTASITRVLEATDLTKDEVDYFVCHQANSRIIQKVAKNLSLPEERFFVNLTNLGNTSAASIPMALDEMVQNDMLKPGMKLVLVGFGAGLTWGASLIEWR